MSKARPAPDSTRLLTLIAVVVAIAGLYFGRQVLIPLSFAVVLAFLLSPVVGWLQKCRLGRVPSVLTVLVLVFALAGSLGWTVAGQLMDVVDQLPGYRSNIHEKIQSFQLSHTSRLRSATNTVTELSNELSAASDASVDKKTTKGTSARPIPVQVAQPPSNASQYVRAVIGPLTGVLETSAIVIVFTLFILIKREDLRNRLIRLAGHDQLHVVTHALDDASQRLSRYLLLQFLVNAVYGLMFAGGAYWIGIPHAILWGVVAGLLRFVPYVGTLIGAVLPTALALAVFPGWMQAGLILGLFVVLELVLGNIVEPLLYGAHTGISSLAILVAAVFWSVLWGPMGLILSTPLTVCLILVGRYVPQLSFLEVLLGDEAVLPVESHFYQRLLALDQEEARSVAKSYLEEKPVGSFYDTVLIPALALAEKDRHLDSLEPGTVTFVYESVRELIDENSDRYVEGDRVLSPLFTSPAPSDGVPVVASGNDDLTVKKLEGSLVGMSCVCIPAVDEADELVSMMLEQLLGRLGCDVTRLPIDSVANTLRALTHSVPRVAVISALPPLASGAARSLCRQLRQRYPEMKLIVGLWSGDDENAATKQDRVGLGAADRVVTSLKGAVSFLVEMKGDISPKDEHRKEATAVV